MQSKSGSVVCAKALVMVTCALFSLGVEAQTGPPATTVKFRGRYIPELYRADRGRYIPDDSGKYRHMKVPYNGGYGDRGLKYEHDDSAKYKLPPEAFGLGPRDHLRFMIDFNYNGTGWQIIEFDWVRDGDETKKYNYSNQNQLWQRMQYNSQQNTYGSYEYGDQNTNSDYMGQQDIQNGAGEIYSNQDDMNEPQSQIPPDDSTSIHLNGEYDNSEFTYNYSNDEMEESGQEAAAMRHSTKDVRDAITEILDYVKTNIIPNLS